MSFTRIYELRGEPDKYPGFLQAFTKDPPDKGSWTEDVGIRSIQFGPAPFGTDYTPVPLEFDNEGKRKKNVVGDICLSMQPFVVFSDKARQALNAFLSPVGEFLEVGAPMPGFIGYRLLKRLGGCIDMGRSVYTKYDNGNVMVRKPTMHEAKVRGHDLFAVAESPTGLYVSEAFKAAVEAAKLKGFNFSREVPLT